MLNKIIIKNAREHNLKNVDLELPKNKLIVFTGISGSGKSSLAFDTIFAEGQRRYIESLSSYARQFLGQMEKPDVEYIEGLSPAISIDQKSAGHNPRSTVGTVTEIYDYLRLLYAKIGVPHCSSCGKAISSTSVEQIVDSILELPEGTKITVYAPVIRGKKGEYSTLLNDLYREGFSQARINGKIHKLDQKIELTRYKMHKIEILIDKIILTSDNLSQISEAVETAVKLANGFVLISYVIARSPEASGRRSNLTKRDCRAQLFARNDPTEKLFNQSLMCPDCEISFPEIEPRLFSFNSPFGACPECNGLGIKHEIDPSLIISDKTKTISEAGVLPWNYKSNNFYGTVINAVAEKLGYYTHTRLSDWSKDDLNHLLYGGEFPEKIKLQHFSSQYSQNFYMNFNGLIPYLERRWKETQSETIRREVEKYMSNSPCSVCHGARLKKDALLVKIDKKNIAEVTKIAVKDAKELFLNLQLTKREMLIAEKILKEIGNRLDFLVSVGLDYLTLDRRAGTLAGGESQRIRLASQIGSALTGVLYVLDEPSIGLHARDNKKLLDILKKLRDLGNTVIVVEHDEETIREADWVCDIGPGAGISGGKVVFNGNVNDLLKNDNSITAKFLNRKEKIEVPEKHREIKGKFISIKGATEHNLKNITVHFPLGVLTCITGVSGSGKSTLVNDIFYKALSRKINGSCDMPGKHHSIEGFEEVLKIINITQAPIGRTPRSNPATYTGLFTPIRELFSKTREAKIRGYSLGRFSFNVYGGRCETCKGDGLLKIEMQFLPDVYIPCDTCIGRRYNRETLSIHFKGKTIADVLKMTVAEALEFFQNIPKIADILQLLSDVGLDYIELGQYATTLSGGEAQRIKLASELSKRQTGKNLYILDEPTTGLHFADIKKLLSVLNRLVDAGNTIVIIEHNLDVIKCADHIIDLGLEGGEGGGKIIATGTPEEIAKTPQSYTGQFLKKVL